MNTRKKLTALVIAILFSGASLAATMTEQQIKNEAVKVAPGTTVEHASLIKKHGNELWHVTVKGKEGTRTLYFTTGGIETDAMGKAMTKTN
jgi:predicted flavoprotein YhiN